MTIALGPGLELVGLSVRRRGVPILDSVDWTIRDGERWVVLGPNGAGKTTLVRILSTYLIASAGVVTGLGRRIGRANVQDLRRQIGYLRSNRKGRCGRA